MILPFTAFLEHLIAGPLPTIKCFEKNDVQEEGDKVATTGEARYSKGRSTVEKPSCEMAKTLPLHKKSNAKCHHYLQVDRTMLKLPISVWYDGYSIEIEFLFLKHFRVFGSRPSQN